MTKANEKSNFDCRLIDFDVSFSYLEVSVDN